MRKSGEISCRFDLDPEDCGWLSAALTRLGAKLTEETKAFTLYLDTETGAIGNYGLTLSIRHRGEITSDDIKATISNTAKGLSALDGWTRSVEPLSAATPPEAHRWLGALLRGHDTQQSLRLLFRIETQGQRWRTRAGDTEISLDRACITANRSQASFATVDFVGKREADFFQLLAEINVPPKLRMSAETVALRGYRFCGVLRDSYVTAFAPKLAANMDAATAFRVMARACFDHFLVNEASVRKTREREAVHQCRVALRRLSTCLRLFSSFVSGAAGDAIRADLKAFSTHLEKARDLDVLIADVVAPAIGSASSDAAKTLLRSIEERRNGAYDELVAALSAPQAATLFLHVAEWIEAGDWSRNCAREKQRQENIACFAKRKLAKATHKFKACCEEIEEADHERRHRIRIRAKNLRYSSEFFETLVAPEALPGKPAHAKTAHKRFEAFIAALKDWQAILGKQNDVLMARHFLASLAKEAGKDAVARPAIDAVAASIEVSETKFRRKARKAQHALAEIEPFWKEFSKAA
jgi:triphosphatase